MIYHRKTNLGDREVRVQVDLLAGEYEGSGTKHRHQKVQRVQARKARGCDLAFERTVEVTVSERPRLARMSRSRSLLSMNRDDRAAGEGPAQPLEIGGRGVARGVAPNQGNARAIQPAR